MPLLEHYVSLSLKWYQLRAYFVSAFLKKKNANTSYAVVSACFNVEEYIDCFIKSLLCQTLDFKNNIQVVLVDDGSTDSTWEKLLYWQRKYPKNILTLHKQNGGQGSARNFGLPYVQAEWVTFADPDDFYDPFAFEEVDKIIGKYQKENLSFVSLNYIPFYENQKGFVEDHPLSFRFNNERTIKRVKFLKSFIQLSSNSLFIKKAILGKNIFPTSVRPTFEDAFFVNYLFLENMEQRICFSKKARYYFRKRKNCSSTLDLCWTDKRQFDDVLKFGVLELLRRSELKLGRVPVFIQNVVIYHIQWYFRQLKNREDRIFFLSERERKNFIYLLKKCFSYIDPNIFFEFTCPGLGKVVLTEISLFLLDSSKNTSVGLITYADISAMQHQKEVRLMLLVKEETDAIRFYLGGREVNPISVGYAKNTFCGTSLSYWCIVWLALADQQNKMLSVTVNGQICPILIEDSYVREVELPAAMTSFSLDQNRNAKKNSKYANCWLISDRDCQADDNGEHFYRYLKNNGFGVNAWFLLNKKSHDWRRLEEEGFKLIDYGSREHKNALKTCSLLISSHADEYVINAFGDKTNRRVPFIFLQHGVIKDDLSQWLNPKKIRLMVTSTTEERKSIIHPHSKYQYTEREVVLTGLPRYDALTRKRSPEKIILVMPTWRNSLVGNLLKGTARSHNQTFMDSEYARKWGHFLTSQNLFKLLQVNGYRLLFFPHAYIQQYIKDFNLPKHIEICTHRTHRFQEVIGSAAIMITDYSSVAFDMAYLEKEVIYYQFDKGEIFKNNVHTYQKGYFEYSRDGFGPVIETQDELLSYIDLSLKRNCRPEEKYLERMQRVFPYKDGKCCERIYNIVKKL